MVADMVVVERQHATQEVHFVLCYGFHKILVVTGEQEHRTTLARTASIVWWIVWVWCMGFECK